jgi:hypothetical protein
MFTAASSDIFREVPDRVQIDTTQKRQKTTENQNAMGRQPSLNRTDVREAINAGGGGMACTLWDSLGLIADRRGRKGRQLDRKSTRLNSSHDV